MGVYIENIEPVRGWIYHLLRSTLIVLPVFRRMTLVSASSVTFRFDIGTHAAWMTIKTFRRHGFIPCLFASQEMVPFSFSF